MGVQVLGMLQYHLLLPTTANRHRDTTHTRNKPGNIKPKTPTQTKNTKATYTQNTHTRHTKPYQLTHASPGDIPSQTHDPIRGDNGEYSRYGGALAI